MKLLQCSHSYDSKTQFSPILAQDSISIPTQNMRKHEFFEVFGRYGNETLG